PDGDALRRGRLRRLGGLVCRYLGFLLDRRLGDVRDLDVGLLDVGNLNLWDLDIDVGNLDVGLAGAEHEVGEGPAAAVRIDDAQEAVGAVARERHQGAVRDYRDDWVALARAAPKIDRPVGDVDLADLTTGHHGAITDTVDGEVVAVGIPGLAVVGNRIEAVLGVTGDFHRGTRRNHVEDLGIERRCGAQVEVI